ncbi:MAG: response regulator transcription factor [Ginsengibacter sp.]
MKRILVVDDNIDILQIVKIILENYGFEVLVTPKGDEIFSKTDTFNPQLILMDVFLSSGIDGREICKTLKSNAQTKDIPVILFSAQVKLEDVFQSWGADDFISKPFEVKELIGKIKSHLQAN